MFEGSGKALSEAGLSKAATDIGVGLPELWAVMTVETKGCGFLSDRRPLVLFERHVFHKRTNGRFDTAAPDLSAPTQGGYGAGGAFQHDRLAQAIALERKAALESASWGLGQVMGYNAGNVGFADVEDMVRAMCNSEDAQFQAMVGFIKSNNLSRFLQHGDWASFAKGYNGPEFKKNRYDEKLAEAHARYVKGPLPDLKLRAAQLKLTYLGFNPGPVDGWSGTKTQAALSKFQTSRNLPATGKLDDATSMALEAAEV
jgi:hypothetical protein